MRINGTKYGDTLYDTYGNDVIHGNGGDDYIFANRGGIDASMAMPAMTRSLAKP